MTEDISPLERQPARLGVVSTLLVSILASITVPASALTFDDARVSRGRE